MTATLNASTSNGVILTSDTSGSLAIQSNGNTIATAQSTGLSISSYTGAASLITSGTAVSASGTSVIFSIPSWAKRIVIMLNGVAMNAAANIIFRLGTSGGIIATGYLGRQANIVASTCNGQNETTGFILGTGNNTSDIWYGALTVNNLNANTWTATGTFSQTGATTFTSMPSGAITLGSALTQVSVTTSGGTASFNAGTINIQYN
jgi:hypothetical protein